MSYTFRPAIRTEAKPLIGLYSESGCGKTLSALLLAKGFAGDMSKVGMVETESGRGEVYAEDPVVGGYRVLSIRDDFSPRNYGDAITEAGHAGLSVLIIDSASHEWEGAGGVLSMAAQNQEGGKKGPLVWQIPKLDHARHFMLKLLQTPVPLVIVCMRAKYPMKEIIKDGKKEWTRSEILEPKQSDDILFEMMVHAWIDAEHKLHVTKFTESGLKGVFIDQQPISIETGKRLAEWAKGGAPKPAVDSAALLADLKKRVSACSSEDQLRRMSNEIGAAKKQMNDAEWAELDAACKEKVRSLRQPAAQPTPAPAEPTAEESVRALIRERFTVLGMSVDEQAESIASFIGREAALTDLDIDELNGYLADLHTH
jgi:hypothetical protein